MGAIEKRESRRYGPRSQKFEGTLRHDASAEEEKKTVP
jgi:hypothetical protein